MKINILRARELNFLRFDCVALLYSIDCGIFIKFFGSDGATASRYFSFILSRRFVMKIA